MYEIRPQLWTFQWLTVFVESFHQIFSDRNIAPVKSGPLGFPGGSVYHTQYPEAGLAWRATPGFPVLRFSEDEVAAGSGKWCLTLADHLEGEAATHSSSLAWFPLRKHLTTCFSLGRKAPGQDPFGHRGTFCI